MAGWLTGSAAWLWLAAGVLLIAAEALVSGVVLIWFGAAALVCGLAFSLIDLDLSQQVLLWAVLSLVALALGRPVVRRWQRDREALGDRLNARGRLLIGQTAHLSAPIVDGHGRVTLRDGAWSVAGPDLPAGALIRVTAVDGNVLTVEAVEAVEAVEPDDAPKAR